MFPLVGDRYKCATCYNFDLCSTCEAKPGSHPISHPLVKFKRPEIVEHEGVKCDGCGVYPITGDRFKCMVCPQYDMCQQCEEKRLHDVNHPLVKLRVELRTLPRSLIRAVGVADEEAEVKVAKSPSEDAKRQSEKDASEKAARKAEKQQRKEARRQESEQKKAAKKAAKSATEVRVVVPSLPSSSPIVAVEVITPQAESKTPVVISPTPVAIEKVAATPVVRSSASIVAPSVIVGPVDEVPAIEVVNSVVYEEKNAPVPEAAVPLAEPVAVPVIPLALPVTPVSLLAPELEAKLQTLSAMGFTDRQHTCLLLARFDGDLQRVVEALLFV